MKSKIRDYSSANFTFLSSCTGFCCTLNLTWPYNFLSSIHLYFSWNFWNTSEWFFFPKWKTLRPGDGHERAGRGPDKEERETGSKGNKEKIKKGRGIMVISRLSSLPKKLFCQTIYQNIFSFTAKATFHARTNQNWFTGKAKVYQTNPNAIILAFLLAGSLKPLLSVGRRFLRLKVWRHYRVLASGGPCP